VVNVIDRDDHRFEKWLLLYTQPVMICEIEAIEVFRGVDRFRASEGESEGRQVGK
jgi:hypothetical protein